MALHNLPPRVRAAAEHHLHEPRSIHGGQDGKTPLMVVDLDEAAHSVLLFRHALPRVVPYYAVKANPDRPLLRLFRQLGLRFDVASLGEIRTLTQPPGEESTDAAHAEDPATGLGVEPERLIFANPVKRPRAIREAIQRGVTLFTADAPEELAKIDREVEAAGRTKPVDVLIRMWVPNFGSVVDLSSKFGADETTIAEMVADAREHLPRVRVRGIAFHVGSQCVNPANYQKAITLARQQMDAVAAKGVTLDMLDIGGGFPVNYTRRVSYVEDVLQALRQSLAEIPEDITVIAEPGRTFCATASTLFTSLIGRTERNGRPWYFIDDSIYQTFSGKIYDFIDYDFFPLHGEMHPATEVTVAGCSCDGHDIISRQALLPPTLAEGTILYAPNIGAYTTASSSAFNGFEPARRIFLPPKPETMQAFADLNPIGSAR